MDKTVNQRDALEMKKKKIQHATHIYKCVFPPGKDTNMHAQNKNILDLYHFSATRPCINQLQGKKKKSYKWASHFYLFSFIKKGPLKGLVE